jgi:enoyl-CoA hydratase/carnithine racemase
MFSLAARSNAVGLRLLSTTASESAIRIAQRNRLLVLELNRPKALNALSLDMCAEIKTLLREKINVPTPEIGAFVMKGAGGKAFCAGGDVKAIWQELQTANPIGTGKPGLLHNDFFRQEYIMNYLLGTSLAPQVSFWDGIVMGGGVGVSVLGEFRVATEKSLFAMPETAIGLFPDVGSSAWLPHLPEGYGAYIGRLFVHLYMCKLVIHTYICLAN